MERKATDILLDLEEKLDKLLSYVVNMDNNYKIILSRIDNLKSSTVSVASSSNNRPPAETKPALEPVKNETEEELDNFIDVSNSSIPSKVLKVKVSQVVKYPKSKGLKQNNVVLASVKIYDFNGREGGNIVGENRTDQNGRWKIDLSPGKYFVHILKPASTQKPQIDHYFPISVDDDKMSLDLEPLS